MFARWCGKYLLIGVAMMLVVGLLPIGRDDTDPGAWGARSGLVPSTDALTGCQYLRTSAGGLTPRMTSDGKHLGCSR